MQAAEYQVVSLITEHTPDFVRLEDHTPEENMLVARLIHATLGMMSEVGEIADALKKHIIYKKALDDINLLEESGDVSWYQSLFLTAIKKTFEESFKANIAKLSLRYPDNKFTLEAANNRNLEAERRALEGKHDEP